MVDLGEEMGNVQEEVSEAEELVKAQLEDLFKFDVSVSDPNYDANSNKIKCQVQVSPHGENDIENVFEGVSINTGGSINFAFNLEE